MKTKPIKKSVPLWAKTGHKAPVTRREFLASGVLPFAATMLAPNWLQLLTASRSHAQAASCLSAGSGLIPFVTVNLAGGAGLASNFVPTDEGRNLLSSYTKMGLGDGNLPILREFGNVPFAGAINGNNADLLSKFLQGLKEMAPNATARTAFVGVCVRSRDDSTENPFSIDGLLSQVGLQGSSLPRLGNRESITGIRQQAAVVAPTAPLVVNDFTDISSSLGYASQLGSNLNKNQQTLLSQFISRLNGSQARKLASLRSGTEIQSVIECAGIKNSQILSGTGAASVDPRTQGNISNIWGINNNTPTNNMNLVFASMAYNAILGNSGAVGLDMGGYDYHDNTRTNGDNADLQAGRTVGRVLETAHILQKPVFIYVCTDGAVTSPDSADRRAPWVSDRGTAGASYILYYNPAGRPTTSDYQIGHFTNGQVADDRSLVGANPEVSAAAVFANYLQANKRLDLFAPLAGRLISANNLAQVLRFG